MNYFAHGHRFIDDPYFLAGTAVPDWLSVVDRKVRVRSRQAEPHIASADPRVASVAQGVLQHLHDDAWFHETRAFAELSLALCQQFRDGLPVDDGFRPHFLGHIVVEILLDSVLIAASPHKLEGYYRAIDSLDTEVVQSAVNAMSPRGTTNLSTFIGLFSRERFLADYADDDRLRYRLNQVMRRVGLSTLPVEVLPVLAAARAMVAARSSELLPESRQSRCSGTSV